MLIKVLTYLLLLWWWWFQVLEKKKEKMNKEIIVRGEGEGREGEEGTSCVDGWVGGATYERTTINLI